MAAGNINLMAIRPIIEYGEVITDAIDVTQDDISNREQCVTCVEDKQACSLNT